MLNPTDLVISYTIDAMELVPLGKINPWNRLREKILENQLSSSSITSAEPYQVPVESWSLVTRWIRRSRSFWTKNNAKELLAYKERIDKQFKSTKNHTTVGLD
jgi:hypothetical protein